MNQDDTEKPCPVARSRDETLALGCTLPQVEASTEIPPLLPSRDMMGRVGLEKGKQHGETPTFLKLTCAQARFRCFCKKLATWYDREPQELALEGWVRGSVHFIPFSHAWKTLAIVEFAKPVGYRPISLIEQSRYNSTELTPIKICRGIFNLWCAKVKNH